MNGYMDGWIDREKTVFVVSFGPPPPLSPCLKSDHKFHKVMDCFFP